MDKTTKLIIAIVIILVLAIIGYIVVKRVVNTVVNAQVKKEKAEFVRDTATDMFGKFISGIKS